MPTLTLPGEFTSLDAIGDFVLEQARLAGLDKHATYQLQLAVDELATNSIIHGYQEHGLTGDIVISADIDDHALTIVIEDSAVPFDPLQRDLERVEENFDKAAGRSADWWPGDLLRPAGRARLSLRMARWTQSQYVDGSSAGYDRPGDARQ